MIKNKTGVPKWLVYIGAPVLSIGIMLVIYAIRGYYPFGDGTIVDIDLGAAVLPAYTNLYDVLHGNASAFFDWYTAAGLERFSYASLLSPTIYFLLLFPRNALMDAFSLLLIVKLAVTAFTSSVFFSKIFSKLPSYWVVVFGLMYAFSGYNIQYYTNIDWLDCVALFPLLILAGINMLRGRSKIPFILILSYMLVTGVYFAFFVFLFLIVIGGLYIYTFTEKDTRKDSILRLGISAASSLIISAPVFVPSLMSLLTSSRFESTTDTASAGGIFDSVLEILNTQSYMEPNKILMLMGLEFSLVSLVLLWIKFKRDKKAPVFFTLSFLLLCSQIIFKNVDLLWHGGSYMSFPFRNGYMLSFVMCCCAAYYCEHYDILYDRKEKHKIISYALPTVSVLSFYVILPIVYVWSEISHGIGNIRYNTIAGTAAMRTFLWSVIPVILGFVFFRFIGSRRFRTLFTTLLIVSVICINAFGFIGANSINSIDSIRYNNQMNDELHQAIRNEDVMDRINSPDSSLSCNYPYYIERAALSNWTHNLGTPVRQALWDLGFSAYYTEALDTGGTAFSKALMNIKDTLSIAPISNELYEFSGEYSAYCYYKNRITLPLGLVFDRKLIEIKSDGDTFRYQNEIYSALTGDSEPLFSEAVISDRQYTEKKITPDDNYNNFSDLVSDYTAGVRKTVRLKVDIKEKSALYFKFDLGVNAVFRLPEDLNCLITLNGKPFMVSSSVVDISVKSNEYPNENSDNLLELGVFENEEVELELVTNGELGDICLYTMDMDRLSKLCTSYECENDCTVGDKSLDITVSSDEDGKYVFLPIAYSQNWSCTVNGESREIQSVLGDFMAVELNEGDNNVSLRLSVWKHYAMYGAVLLLAVIIVLLCSISERKKTEASNALKKVSSLLFAMVFAAVIICVYVIPAGFNVYNLIMRLIS